MKKTYEKPKVKKVSFHYTQVLASSTKCGYVVAQDQTHSPGSVATSCYHA